MKVSSPPRAILQSFPPSFSFVLLQFRLLCSKAGIKSIRVPSDGDHQRLCTLQKAFIHSENNQHTQSKSLPPMAFGKNEFSYREMKAIPTTEGW